MLETLSNKNKPRGKNHIPAFGRMVFDAIESEKDELIQAIDDAAEQQAMELAYANADDGEQLIGFWDKVKDDLDSGIDTIDFALDDE